MASHISKSFIFFIILVMALAGNQVSPLIHDAKSKGYEKSLFSITFIFNFCDWLRTWYSWHAVEGKQCEKTFYKKDCNQLECDNFCGRVFNGSGLCGFLMCWCVYECEEAPSPSIPQIHS